MTRRPQPAAAAPVRIVGAPRTPIRDVYHLFLRAPWLAALAGIVGAYLAINAGFAAAYWFVGGIANASPGSFADAFHFSIQTLGTIGYGSMYPTTSACHALVAAESVVGLLVVALATGLVFAKFSRSTARIAFGQWVAVAPMNGVPTLMLRIGNERGNNIVDTVIRVTMVRTEKTREGQTFYRMIDLPLTRERSPALSRSWTVMHTIDARSPLHGETPASCAAAEMELLVSLVGLDDISLQPVHASHNYLATALAWGKRHADVLSELPDGTLLLDVRKFDDLVDVPATPDFPYGSATRSGSTKSARARSEKRSSRE